MLVSRTEYLAGLEVYLFAISRQTGRDNAMKRPLFFFWSGVEAYYALDLESREVLELDVTFIDDEPLNSWESLDHFTIDFI